MELNLKKLKELAISATPGPWDFDTAETPFRIAGGEVVGGDALPYGDVYTVAEWETPDGSESLVVAQEIGTANGRFIAAANPAAILALLAQVEAAPSIPAQTVAVSDVEQSRALWEAALAHAAVYVEAHCADGAHHAETIMSMKRPVFSAAPLADKGQAVEMAVSDDDATVAVLNTPADAVARKMLAGAGPNFGDGPHDRMMASLPIPLFDLTKTVPLTLANTAQISAQPVYWPKHWSKEDIARAVTAAHGAPGSAGSGKHEAESLCTLTDSELADPEFVRTYIESHLDSFDCAMREIARLRLAAGESQP